MEARCAYLHGIWICGGVVGLGLQRNKENQKMMMMMDHDDDDDIVFQAQLPCRHLPLGHFRSMIKKMIMIAERKRVRHKKGVYVFSKKKKPCCALTPAGALA